MTENTARKTVAFKHWTGERKYAGGLYLEDTNEILLDADCQWACDGNWKLAPEETPITIVPPSEEAVAIYEETKTATTGNPFDVPDYGITTYPRTFGFSSTPDLTVRQVHGIYHKDTHTFVVDPQDYWVFDGGRFSGPNPPKVIPQSHYIEADVEGYTKKILQRATQGATQKAGTGVTPSALLREWNEAYAEEEDGLEALCQIIEEYGNAPLSPSVEYALRRTLSLK